MIVVQEYRPNLADRVFHKIGQVAHDGDIDLLECQCFAIAVAWGACKINPFTDSTYFNTNFAALADYAPRWFWGALMLAGALCQFIGYLIHSVQIRQWGVATKLLLWAFLGFVAVQNMPARESPYFYFIFAATSFLVLLRLNRFHVRV